MQLCWMNPTSQSHDSCHCGTSEHHHIGKLSESHDWVRLVRYDGASEETRYDTLNKITWIKPRDTCSQRFLGGGGILFFERRRAIPRWGILSADFRMVLSSSAIPRAVRRSRAA